MLSGNTGSFLLALCLIDKKRKVEDNFEVWEKKIACILRKRCQASEMVVQKVGRLSHLNQREVVGVGSSGEGGRESRKEGGVVEC